MNIILESSELSECPERALGQCFHFGSLSSEDSRIMFIFVRFVHSMNQENISHFWADGNVSTYLPKRPVLCPVLMVVAQ